MKSSASSLNSSDNFGRRDSSSRAGFWVIPAAVAGASLAGITGLLAAAAGATARGVALRSLGAGAVVAVAVGAILWYVGWGASRQAQGEAAASGQRGQRLNLVVGDVAEEAAPAMTTEDEGTGDEGEEESEPLPKGLPPERLASLLRLVADQEDKG